MLKAGKASEAAKHLQQALDLKVSSTGLCWGCAGVHLPPRAASVSLLKHP
jgi:hypothetical protein